jgi:hypothetical protein
MTPKSFKQKVLDKNYNFYGDETLIQKYKKSKSKLELFTIGKYISDDDLEKEYQSRGLVPAHPEDILSSWKDEEYIGTHWKDADGKWCCAAFSRWDGERRVRVNRYDYDWSVDWFFAGLRKSSKLEPKHSSETVSFELRLKKIEKYLSETFKDF